MHWWKKMIFDDDLEFLTYFFLKVDSVSSVCDRDIFSNCYVKLNDEMVYDFYKIVYYTNLELLKQKIDAIELVDNRRYLQLCNTITSLNSFLDHKREESFWLDIDQRNRLKILVAFLPFAYYRNYVQNNIDS